MTRLSLGRVNLSVRRYSVADSMVRFGSPVNSSRTGYVPQQSASCRQMCSKGVKAKIGRAFRAQVGDVIGHRAAAREDDELRVRQRVRQHDGGAHGLLPRHPRAPLRAHNPAPPLRSMRRATRSKTSTHFTGYLPDGGLAAEHDRVGLLEDGVGHVGDFRARRHRVGDHRLEHVRGDDDRLAELEAALDDVALDDRQLFHRAFDAEIAARDHDRHRSRG